MPALRPLAIASAFAAIVLAIGVQTAHAGMTVAEHQLAREINHARVEHGLCPLRVSIQLSNAARAHDVEMSTNGFFAHESVDGSPFWRRVLTWYPPRGRGWLAGENILWDKAAISSWTMVTRWLHSPPHRAILLNPSWRELGIAVLRVESAPGVYQGEAATIITTDFGVRGR
jgi:uncharacterized protein YkwD